MKKLLIALVGLACAAVVAAQTTSTVEGTIRDPEGKPVEGATVTITGPAFERTVTSDAAGLYRILAVPPGLYTINASREGFSAVSLTDLQVDLNRTLSLDLGLAAGSVQQTVTVTGEAPLLDRTDVGTGGVVTPRQIETLPVNGRDYLDLMQLIPGVTVNRSADEGSDTTTPVLGERAGNAVYLVDGMPNRSEFSGGPATQFNQDSIFEFEVLTDGYQAEFGHGSGGVVNVVTKSGGNDWRAAVIGFWRDDALDSSNSLEDGQDAPELERWDVAGNVGGPLVRDVAYMFASAESIDEDRQLNFTFPPATPGSVRDVENAFDNPTHDEETRLFARFDEQLGARHRLTQSLSWTEQDILDFLPLSQATSLPSTRRSFDRERKMFGLRDTSLFGDGDSPWLFDGFLQYRDDSDTDFAAHPEAGPLTAFNIFSSTTTFGVFGDLGTVNFGSSRTDSLIEQEYGALGASVSRTLRRNDLKGGIDYLRTEVDGHEYNIITNQLFATEANYNRFGPIYSGFFTATTVGGLTPDANTIRLRNDYTGLYLQDEWKVTETLVVNLGVRWDYDSEFEDDDNYSPRVGIAWSPTEKTVVRASAGLYYDRFRLGLVRDVPPFGGADLRVIQPFSYPQLFNNVTTIAPVLFGICINPVLTEAQIAASGAPCPLGPFAHYGKDRLSNLVAAGRAPVAPETVVTIDNVQELTGLTPTEYLARVTAAVPLIPGLEWFWGPFGALSHTGLPASQFPVSLDPSFETPHSEAYNLGIEQQLGRDWLLTADYHHREIEDILGVRVTNIAFAARIPGRQLEFEPGTPSTFVNGFGPWYEGEVDAATVSVTKRMRDNWAFTAYYTYMDAEDNARVAQLGDANLGSTSSPGFPSDSFIGVPGVVVDPTTGQTNANGPFVASNGNPVPQAGVFYNGPDLDRGTSSLALEHTFVVFGQVRLPLNFELAAIFRHQSGFPFSRATTGTTDIDGTLNFNTRDYDFERNSFEAPEYTTLDARAAWHFDLGGRVAGTILLEFFNLTNEQNPAAIEDVPGRPTDFGEPLQVLPGREGQFGVRFEFGGGR
jgi:outer membrane receptor protein involved in Fe transport